MKLWEIARADLSKSDILPMHRRFSHYAETSGRNTHILRGPERQLYQIRRYGHR